MGAPVVAVVVSSAANLSSSGSPFQPAKTRKVSSWRSERIQTAKVWAASTRGYVLVRWSAQKRTVGGSVETEQKEEATMPWLSGPRRAVTTVIPLVQRLITARKVSIGTLMPPPAPPDAGASPGAV